MTIKSIEDYFVDWEAHVFGFGYGTGEDHTIPALKRFLAAVPIDGAYDYKVIEDEIGPIVAWLMINALCRVDILEYGTSPRYAWLTSKGKRLKEFCDIHAAQELIDIICRPDSNYVHCYPDGCNCGPQGYEAGRKCGNQFWEER